MGERKKSRDHVFDVVPCGCLDPFCRSSRTRDCCRVKVDGDVVRRGQFRGTMDASGRLIISRNSFIVKAASSGPRRPMIETCFTVERESRSRTGQGTSHCERTLTLVSSIRATSSETLPFPMMDTCDTLSSGGGEGVLGCWVYQCTRESAGIQLGDGGNAS